MPASSIKNIQSLIQAKLQEVLDPELFISIIDLGLVYDISVSPEGKTHILMTLTTLGCPLFQTIENEIKEKVLSVPGITDVSVELTFDPPWDQSKMSESAKAELGME